MLTLCLLKTLELTFHANGLLAGTAYSLRIVLFEVFLSSLTYTVYHSLTGDLCSVTKPSRYRFEALWWRESEAW